MANVRTFLNRGTELTGTAGPQTRIDLFKRDQVAGLRYGIEGMRVGGRRTLIISPHLAYGAAGVDGLIPPNAVLRCEVELLEVREPGVWTPEDYPHGRQLCIFHPGEAVLELPRWQFGLHEDGRCGIGLTHPRPGRTTAAEDAKPNAWRRAHRTEMGASLDLDTTSSLFAAALALPSQFPQECLGHDEVWSDMMERGNGITRDRKHYTLCVTIYILERGQHSCYYSVKETSQAWLTSPLRALIHRRGGRAVVSAWRRRLVHWPPGLCLVFSGLFQAFTLRCQWAGIRLCPAPSIDEERAPTSWIPWGFPSTRPACGFAIRPQDRS